MDKQFAEDKLIQAVRDYDPFYTQNNESRIWSEFVYKEITGINTTLLLLRDQLILLGKVLEEHPDGGYYISSIAIKHNPTLVFIGLESGTVYIAAYAKEGLIKQHTAEKAAIVLKKAMDQLS